MIAPLSFTSGDFLAIAPPLLMGISGSTSLLLGFTSRRQAVSTRRPLQLVNLLAIVLVGFSLLWQMGALSNGVNQLHALRGTMAIDGPALFFNGVIWAVTLGLLLISDRFLESVHENAAEYYGLVSFAQCGMYFMCAGADLVFLMVGVELTSIAFYILVGFTRSDRRSNEAALKYLLLGALSSAFLLYGFSFLYGLSGSTSLNVLHAVLQRGIAYRFLLVGGTVVSVIGLLFKVSAAPFHNWAPDAYEGAPTPVTGYLAVASNIAAFAVLLRLLNALGPDAVPIWTPLIAGAAILSLTIGSFAALTQTGLKRLFAYSGVTHTGYVLLGILANSALGFRGVLVYILVYAVTNGGAFALLASLQEGERGSDQLADLRGLSRRHPLHAAFFVVLLLSLAGIPPTAGFLGKYFIFAALVQTGHFALAAVGSIFAVIGLYFYFRLVREMYSDPEPIIATSKGFPTGIGTELALAASATLTVFIGLFPEAIVRNAASFAARAIL